MISKFKLPFIFDPEPLKSDLEALADDDWVAHFNTGYFEGDWSGVSLRSIGGQASKLYPDPHSGGAVMDTPLLERLPNLRRVLEVFRCPINSARLLKLGAGSTIKEHRDYQLGYEEGRVRVHIPVTTNPAVEFFLDGHRIDMAEGECWYLDFNLPHRVKNEGASDRIHLVLDCELNDWLRELLPTATSEPPVVRESSPVEFEKFRVRVLAEPSLQHRLRQVDDRESFIRLAVEVGAEAGYLFSAADVEGAIQAEHRGWMQRWIE
jgi:hypothetical protein